MNDLSRPLIEGFVEISDAETGETLLAKKNAIHPENMSHALALSLSNQGYGTVHKMVFGNGASTVSGTGAITYFPPNTVGAEATLYNTTYSSKVVDARSPLNLDKTNNYMEVLHAPNQTYTDIVVRCLLDYGEPNGQEAFDDATDNEGNYVFDELGLVSYPENGVGEGRLLTHVVFHPLQKSLNRSIAIKYTLRLYLN